MNIACDPLIIETTGRCEPISGFAADAPVLADVVNGGRVMPINFGGPELHYAMDPTAESIRLLQAPDSTMLQPDNMIEKSSGLPWWVWLAAGGVLLWMAKD